MIDYKLISNITITVAFDVSGGMCDRVMLGREGIKNNANATIECFNVDVIDDEDRFEPIKDLSDDEISRAISMLELDNFCVLFVTDKTIVFDNIVIGRDLLVSNVINKDITVVDVNKIEFDENNMYRIF